jgi:hypothetical protein
MVALLGRLKERGLYADGEAGTGARHALHSWVMSDVFKKLNLGGQAVIHVLDAPGSFEQELARLPGVDVKRTLGANDRTTFALAFVQTQQALDTASARMTRAADGDAIVWIAYPKGTSKNYRCEFNRDSGWTVLGGAGFEPVRQVAIDEDWSALRFRRVEHITSLKRDPSRALSASGRTRAAATRRATRKQAEE